MRRAQDSAALAELCYSGREGGWKEGRRSFNEEDDGLDMISLPCVWVCLGFLLLCNKLPTAPGA